MAPCSDLRATARRPGRRGSGENAYKCYQCKKCSTGCPVAPYADMHPAQIMRAVQLGQLDMIFDDKFIWLCTGCETCTTRCPQGIDIAAIMDELKIIARRDGRLHRGAPFANMLTLNYESLKRWGRLYEVELSRATCSRGPTARRRRALGPKMMLKGKINPCPTRGDTAGHEAHGRRPPPDHQGPRAQAGAAAPAAREVRHEKDARLLPRLLAARHRHRARPSLQGNRPALDLKLPEIPGWECCGNTAAHSQPPARRRPAGQRAGQGREGHEAGRGGRALRRLLQPLQDRRPRSRARTRRWPTTCAP